MLSAMESAIYYVLIHMNAREIITEFTVRNNRVINYWTGPELSVDFNERNHSVPYGTL